MKEYYSNAGRRHSVSNMGIIAAIIVAAAVIAAAVTFLLKRGSD